MGTLLALAGVAVISYSPLQQDVPLLSVLAVVGGAICFAQALVLVRRFPRVHPVSMNAVGMTAGAAVLLAASLVADEPIALPHRPETWAAMAYLVVVGSVVVFLLYLVVLRYWAASRASYGFVIIPFVTLVLSAWLDNEPVGVGLVLGGLLVLAGVYVGALRPARITRRPSMRRLTWVYPQAARQGPRLSIMVASNFHTQALEASEPSQMTIDPVTALDRPVGTPMAPRVATRHSRLPLSSSHGHGRDVPRSGPLTGHSVTMP